jgi:hypothetical protein
MSSIKCPSCGLVSLVSASSCKRCKQSLNQLPLEGLRFEQDPKSSQSAALDYLPNPLYRSRDQSNGKLYGKVVGGVLIAVGLLLGLATALTGDYSYLPFAGGAILIGAFVTVIISQNVNRPSSPSVWLKAFQVGAVFTVLGAMYVYEDGLFSFKSLVPLFGIALIVMGVVAYRR